MTLQEKTVTSSSRLLVLEVSNLVSGLLNITVSCVGPYTLQVTGFSPLDFTYQLLDVEDLERGITRRVVGNPLRGKAIKFCLLDIASSFNSRSAYSPGHITLKFLLTSKKLTQQIINNNNK